jgi:transcription initiation factor TFIIIB Brf1 subunit/transcription initiation factor TFIIB
MSYFAIFDKILKTKEAEDTRKESIIIREDSEQEDSEREKCSHENTINEKGAVVCIDCGEELRHKITYEKEWKNFTQESIQLESRETKGEERTIFKDVENLGFAESIVSRANAIYTQVTQGKIFRGNSRKAVVFACIFHSYKLSGKPQTHDALIKIFRLTKKIGLKGLKFVNLHAPKDSNIRVTYISPINLVEEILDKFSATDAQKKEVAMLYEKIRNKSSRLNRARPQSVSAGLVYYWTCLKGKNISMKEFAKKVGLSELTIGKISKTIAEVLHTPDVL